MSVSKQLAGLVVCLAVVFAAGAVGIPFTTHATATWYQDIAKPAWTPPDGVFAPVWTVLYLLMAVAAWLVWRRGGFAANRLALSLFVVQLALNAAWTVIFFGARLFGVASVEIALLWCAILLCTLMLRRVQPFSVWLMLPYLLWVGFASVLNVSIWWLNR